MLIRLIKSNKRNNWVGIRVHWEGLVMGVLLCGVCGKGRGIEESFQPWDSDAIITQGLPSSLSEPTTTNLSWKMHPDFTHYW